MFPGPVRPTEELIPLPSKKTCHGSNSQEPYSHPERGITVAENQLSPTVMGKPLLIHESLGLSDSENL